jgi:MFS family permease
MRNLRLHPVAGMTRQPLWTLILASTAAVMTSVDTMVVTTASPVLRQSPHGSLPDLEWTVNAYNLAFACLPLTGAALGNRFGRRRMFCIRLTAFTAASAAAAMSTTVAALITARAVQGADAALVLPLTLTLISKAFPDERRAAAIDVCGGVLGIGGAAGPVIGGAIVQGISWQWIFWVNVPIGAVTVVLALRLRESQAGRPRFDLLDVLDLDQQVT